MRSELSTEPAPPEHPARPAHSAELGPSLRDERPTAGGPSLGARVPGLPRRHSDVPGRTPVMPVSTVTLPMECDTTQSPGLGTGSCGPRRPSRQAGRRGPSVGQSALGAPEPRSPARAERRGCQGYHRAASIPPLGAGERAGVCSARPPFLTSMALAETWRKPAGKRHAPGAPVQTNAQLCIAAAYQPAAPIL